MCQMSSNRSEQVSRRSNGQIPIVRQSTDTTPPGPTHRAMIRMVLYFGSIASLFLGCAPSGHVAAPKNVNHSQLSDAVSDGQSQSNLSPQTLAFLNGQPIEWADLRLALVESSGGEVCAELILDRMLEGRLAQQNMAVEPHHFETEKTLLAATLDREDPDRAQRLLDQLRQRRGLGQYRFEQLLFRNAAMRQLIQHEVEVSETAIQQAYQYEYGLRFEVRLIVTESFVKAADMVSRARAGESFTDLAIAHSTDSSRFQGGMLGPVSPVDPTYPKAFRAALAGLKSGQVTDPIALDEGFAILRLERTVAGDTVELDSVREKLSRRVRRRVERMAMQRLVRVLLDEAEIIMLDPVLDKSWRQYRRQIFKDQR